jgi:hypothetical protein
MLPVLLPESLFEEGRLWLAMRVDTCSVASYWVEQFHITRAEGHWTCLLLVRVGIQVASGWVDQVLLIDFLDRYPRGKP